MNKKIVTILIVALVISVSANIFILGFTVGKTKCSNNIALNKIEKQLDNIEYWLGIKDK